MLLWLWEILASLIYAVIDFIAIEVILTAIFTFDENNNIKITFGRLFRDTRYKKTSFFIYITLLIIVCYFYISNYIQDNIISYIITIGWKTIPLFTAVVSFAVFWLAKVFAGRNWDFELVWAPLVAIFVSLILILLF